MRPRRGHHRGALLAQIKMALSFILLQMLGLERLSSLRVISEFRLSGGLKISRIGSKLVMSAYLIQSILVAHVFIFGKINWVFFLSKSQ